MTDADQVNQALAELWDTCDSTDAVQTVTDRIEELVKELNTCRMAQAVMDNTVADLEAKLAKAVEVLSFASNVDPADWSEALDVRNQARATLAEIKGESQNGQ